MHLFDTVNLFEGNFDWYGFIIDTLTINKSFIRWYRKPFLCGFFLSLFHNQLFE